MSACRTWDGLIRGVWSNKTIETDFYAVYIEKHRRSQPKAFEWNEMGAAVNLPIFSDLDSLTKQRS